MLSFPKARSRQLLYTLGLLHFQVIKKPIHWLQDWAMNHKPTHSGADDFPNSPLPFRSWNLERGTWNLKQGILRISP